MAVQDCIASRSVLVARGILNVNQNTCPMCGSSSSYGPNAWSIWSKIGHWWHLNWVCPPNIKALLLFWDSFRFKTLDPRETTLDSRLLCSNLVNMDVQK